MPFLRPGQGFSTFEIYSKESTVSKTGRPVQSNWKKTEGSFNGIVINASQQEAEKYKQSTHSVTHKIIQQYGFCKAKATDYLISEKGEYYVMGVKNPAGLDHAMIYFVEENNGLSKKTVEEAGEDNSGGLQIEY